MNSGLRDVVSSLGAKEATKHGFIEQMESIKVQKHLLEVLAQAHFEGHIHKKIVEISYTTSKWHNIVSFMVHEKHI